MTCEDMMKCLTSKEIVVRGTIHHNHGARGTSLPYIQQSKFQAVVCVLDSSTEALFFKRDIYKYKGRKTYPKYKKSINEVDHVIIHVEYGKQHYECS